MLEEGMVEVITYQQNADPLDPKLDELVENSKFLSAGIGFGDIALLYD